MIGRILYMVNSSFLQNGLVFFIWKKCPTTLAFGRTRCKLVRTYMRCPIVISGSVHFTQVKLLDLLSNPNMYTSKICKIINLLFQNDIETLHIF
jgi:hypothetical protein